MSRVTTTTNGGYRGDPQKQAHQAASPLDQVDWAILTELQADARLSMAELARRVHMSGPAVTERVRRMERSGVITGYGARVDPSAVGRPLAAYLRIGAVGAIRDEVAALVNQTPEVIECHRGTGHECFIMKVAVTDVAHLERVIDRFTRLGRITTSIILSTIVPDQGLQPLVHGKPSVTPEP
ncbi:Lrp/AsnC family transcriptional regulator [Nonomuraea sp. KM88]|uniref:Lrp/AsnC family transcriptional regulator n=1 Tax=Nonomuraea sp. KM88 TaxID=3457427 RepID=UPI003FCD6F94